MSEYSTWLTFCLIFFIGALIGGKVVNWWIQRNNSTKPHKLNQDYFKGLNFLLNEEPDKAIEVFIQALEVDSETVELHLALGGLFRRKGQVDRATRIHQNLIARPALTEEHRLNAIYELAQDYYKAGLLDRAENLYLELKDSTSYRKKAIEGLCQIYQKEKEWHKAIEVMGLYKRNERGIFSRRICHYWCELAQQAVNNDDYDLARKYLRSAVQEDKSSLRTILLRGQIYFHQEDYRQAIKLWQNLTLESGALACLVIPEMIFAYKKQKKIDGLKEYLLSLASLPKNETIFNIWQKALFECFGEQQGMTYLLDYVKEEGLSCSVADYLLLAVQKKCSIEQQSALLDYVLNHAKSNNIEYTCVRCGFDARAMHWNCPNCGEWDSFYN